LRYDLAHVTIFLSFLELDYCQASLTVGSQQVHWPAAKVKLVGQRHECAESKILTWERFGMRRRCLVERLVNKLKGFRRIATRYDRRAVHYLGMLTIAAIVL
jgi:transposase